jgi:hypothetical protein
MFYLSLLISHSIFQKAPLKIETNVNSFFEIKNLNQITLTHHLVLT